jgi:hypothetical protein
MFLSGVRGAARGRVHVLQRQVQKRRRHDQLQGPLSHRRQHHLRAHLLAAAHQELHQELDRAGGLVHQAGHQSGLNRDLLGEQPRRAQRLRHLRLLLREGEAVGERDGGRGGAQAALHLDAHVQRPRAHRDVDEGGEAAAPRFEAGRSARIRERWDVRPGRGGRRDQQGQ